MTQQFWPRCTIRLKLLFCKRQSHYDFRREESHSSSITVYRKSFWMQHYLFYDNVVLHLRSFCFKGLWVFHNMSLRDQNYYFLRPWLIYCWVSLENQFMKSCFVVWLTYRVSKITINGSQMLEYGRSVNRRLDCINICRITSCLTVIMVPQSLSFKHTVPLPPEYTFLFLYHLPTFFQLENTAITRYKIIKW